MGRWNQMLAFSAGMALGLGGDPGLAADGRVIHATTYGVEVEAAEADGNPLGGGIMEVRFAYGGCCRLDIADVQSGHISADVWSPWATGRFEPISFPPAETPRPCIGGVGHCSALSEMWDEMAIGGGQSLDARVAALPGNLGTWNFNRYGTYWLKPGDSSDFRFRLETDFGPVTGQGRVLWVNNRVPEPVTWVMLVAGFGLLGATLRRNGLKDGSKGDEPCAN